MIKSKMSRSVKLGAMALMLVLAGCGDNSVGTDGGGGSAGSSMAGTDGGAGAAGTGVAGHGGTSGTGGVAGGGATGSAGSGGTGLTGLAGSGGSGGSGGAGGTAISGSPVDLGSAINYVILAESGISSIPPSIITGNIGVSPAAATYITGFSLVADSSNVFSTSAQVTGMVYAADYAPPTPANLTTAITDMETAFTDAASRAPDFTELGAGDVSGMTLSAGVYKWGTGLLISTDVTLTGSATDVFIFEIAQNLTVADAANIVLSGGVQAKNVFWQVSGYVSLGTTATLNGIILCQTAITLNTGATVNGRLFAQSAVVGNSGTVTAP